MSNSSHFLKCFENIHHATSNQIEEIKEVLIQQVSRSRLVRRVAQYGFEVTVNSHAGPISILIDLHRNPPKPHIAITYSSPSWSTREINEISKLTNTTLTDRFMAIFGKPIFRSLTIDCVVMTEHHPEDILLSTHHEYYPEISGQFSDRDFKHKSLTASSRVEDGETHGNPAIKMQVCISPLIEGIFLHPHNYFQAYNMVSFWGSKKVDWVSISKQKAYKKGIFEAAPNTDEGIDQYLAIERSLEKLDTSIKSRDAWARLTRPIQKLNSKLRKI